MTRGTDVSAAVRPDGEEGRSRMRTRTMAVFAIAGGVLILVGMMLALRDLFGRMGPMLRLLVPMAVMVGCWTAWGVLHRRFPRIGEWLVFFAGTAWWGGLGLLNTVFHLQDETLFFALLLAGTLPIPFLVKSRPLFVLAAVQSVLALMCLMEAPSEQILSLSALTEGAEAAPGMLLSLLGWTWWALCEFFRGRKSLTGAYALGWLPSAGLAFSLGMMAVLVNGVRAFDWTPTTIGAAVVLFGVMTVLRPAVLSRTEAVLLALFAAAFDPIWCFSGGLPPMMRLAVVCGPALFWMVLGYRHGRFGWLMVGIAMVSGAVLAVVAAVGSASLGIALFVLTLGLLLSAGAVLLVLKNRRSRTVKEVAHEAD